MRSAKKKRAPARRRKKLNPELVRQIADLLRDVPDEERDALIDEARRIAFAAPEKNN